MLLQLIIALESCIGHLTNLLRVEILPVHAMESQVKSLNSLTRNHIDKCISNIALILEIDGKIEEVVESLVSAFDCVSKHSLGVLVGYVLDHKRCSAVLSYASWAYRELGYLLACVVASLDADLLDWPWYHDVVVFSVVLCRLLSHLDLLLLCSLLELSRLSSIEDLLSSSFLSPGRCVNGFFLKQIKRGGAASFRPVSESFPLGLAFAFSLFDEEVTARIRGREIPLRGSWRILFIKLGWGRLRALIADLSWV